MLLVPRPADVEIPSSNALWVDLQPSLIQVR